jgi:adenylate kinase family enzyme
MRLADLGPRICIMGPSNSGKSTLATAIGRACGLATIHLDQLFHLPNTDWRPRPAEEFIALHDAALAGARWVMEGNYSRCMPQRFARATGAILLNAATALSLLRYLRRSWFGRDRPGGLEGGRDSVKWEMIRYIVITARHNHGRYQEMLHQVGIPTIELSNTRKIARFYQSEGLER